MLLYLTSSPYNNPISIIKTLSESSTYFKAFTPLTIFPLHPYVSNTYDILSLLPNKATHFLTFLSFFSILTGVHSQYLFCLHIDGSWYSTILPSDLDLSSPGIRIVPNFVQALTTDLACLLLIPSVLLHYVDKLLPCSFSLSDSQYNTASLLSFLSSRGNQISPSKIPPLLSASHLL